MKEGMVNYRMFLANTKQKRTLHPNSHLLSHPMPSLKSTFYVMTRLGFMAKSKFGGLELEMAQVQNLKTWILDMPKSKIWANHKPDSFQISYTKIDTWDADCELPMVDS